MEKILSDADIPSRRRYNKGDYIDSLMVAASVTKDTGKTRYIHPTYFGFVIAKEPPPFGGQYTKAERVEGGVRLIKTEA